MQVSFKFLLPLTPHTVHPAFEDGTDTGFQNVGQLQFDAGEIPRRKYTILYRLKAVYQPLHRSECCNVAGCCTVLYGVRSYELPSRSLAHLADLHFILSLAQSPQWAVASSFMRSLDHTRHNTVGRTPLDE